MNVQSAKCDVRRRAYFQPCPDAMPVEVTVLGRQSLAVVVVQARHGTPFSILTSLGVADTNVATVYVEHVQLLEVRA